MVILRRFWRSGGLSEGLEPTQNAILPLPLIPMATESKTPNLSDESIVAPCRGCGVGIPSHPRDVMRSYDKEGNSTIVMSFNQCDDCKIELEKRVAESKIREAEAKARYEKSLADLINSIPKKTERQIGLDMGLD